MSGRIRRATLLLALAALAGADSGANAQEIVGDREWKWGQMFGVPACYYPCQGSVNHPQCLCYR